MKYGRSLQELAIELDRQVIQPGGALIIRKGLALQPDVQPGVRPYTYSRDEGDFHAENIRIGNGEIAVSYTHLNYNSI